MQPLELSAVALVAAVRQGDITAVQCTEAFLRRIESLNGKVNAFLAVDRDGALARAADIDARRRAGLMPLLERAQHASGQVFMTCTEENWPRELSRELHRWRVTHGTLEPA